MARRDLGNYAIQPGGPGSYEEALRNSSGILLDSRARLDRLVARFLR